MGFLVVVGFLLLAGCMATAPAPTPIVLPTSLPEAASAPMMEELMVHPFTLPPTAPVVTDPLKAIAAANKGAVRAPTSHDFHHAVAVLPYIPGKLYRLDIALQQPLTIMLQPGEAFQFLANGEMRFKIERSENVDPISIAIMPTEANIKTRATLATSLGIYGLELRAHPTTGLAFVSWSHPKAPAPVAPPETTYGIGYGTRGPASAGYTPLFAWDDGRHTYLLFPERMWRTGVPVIHLATGEASHLVNYQSFERQSVYKLNRLLNPGEAFTLSLSPDTDAQVEVLQAEDYQTITCPGHEACDVIRRYRPPTPQRLAAGRESFTP